MMDPALKDFHAIMNEAEGDPQESVQRLLPTCFSRREILLSRINAGLDLFTESVLSTFNR